MTGPAETITCVDCGGVAHLLSFLPEDDQPDPGAALAYRCEDCMERFDVIWQEDEAEELPPSDL